MNKNQLDLLHSNNRSLSGKKIEVIYVEEDKPWADKINQLLMARGATVNSCNGITKLNTSYLHNFRNSFQNEDFILLIKSYNADKSRVWGDILAILVQNEDLISRDFVTFLVLCIDDSGFSDYQSLLFRENRLIEARLNPRVENLFLTITNILNDRDDKKNSNKSRRPKLSESDIPLLHDTVFDTLRTWSENASSDIYNKFFYLRTRNDERFKKGYWFPGDDNFIAVSFWTGGDALNRSPNIFLRIDTKVGGIQVHVVARDSESKRKYFEKLTARLEGYTLYRTMNNYWVKNLSESNSDLEKVLNEFIAVDKQLIDTFLKETLDRIDEEDENLLEEDFSSKFGFLSQEQFYKLKSRVEVERKNKQRETVIKEVLPDALPITISSIDIKDFQGIKQLRLKESDLPSTANWIFLTGKNGFGKTSILRAITLGLTNYDFNREYLNETTKIDVGYNNSGELIQNSTRFAFTSEFKALNSKLTAYGASRLTTQPTSTENNESHIAENIYTLFSSSGTLKDVRFLLKNSSIKSTSEFNNLKNAILEILDHKITDITFDEQANVLFHEADDNKSGEPVQVIAINKFENLATGFQGLINLTADIIVKFSKSFPDQPLNEYKGIVIIDELENHLHPIFQKKLPSLLTKVFPKIQFITSIHSPIPILGAPKNSIILLVKRTLEEGIKAQRIDKMFDLAELNPNLILTSPIFGLSDIFPVQYEKGVNRVKTKDLYDDAKFQEVVKEKLDQYLKG